MRYFGIVEGQIFANGCPSLGNIVVSMKIDLLAFDGSPQALHKHIVPPGTSAVHADGNAGIVQNLGNYLAHWNP